ncbi:MAG: hypothetical protein ACKO9Z_17605 [Planctomycetota bacterium]
MRTIIAGFGLIGAGLGYATAQDPIQSSRHIQGQAPYLFVRIIPPEGWTASIPADREKVVELGKDVIGLRPGYGYRIKLTSKVGISLFPTVEVVGTIVMPPDLKPERHIAAIGWSAEELNQASAGRLLTKLLYVEYPEKAIPKTSLPENPPVTEVEPGDDLLRLALAKGRPVARIVTGSRSIDQAEFTKSAVAGTVWRVDKEGPKTPSSPPWIPLIQPSLDPVLGPPCPNTEVIKDGGDRFPRTVIGGQGEAVGIDPEDTVAEFTPSKGPRRVVPSNRVCIYTPRFCVLAQVAGLGQMDHQTYPAGTMVSQGINGLNFKQPSLATVTETRINGLRSRQRPGGIGLTQYAGRVLKLQVLQAQDLVQTPMANVVEKTIESVNDRKRPQSTVNEERLLIKTGAIGIRQLISETRALALAGTESGPKVVSSQLSPKEILTDCKENLIVLDQPMVLHKSADKSVAIPGEIVTFTLRFSNMTGKDLRDVAIVDSLSPRLEFVEGTSRSNKESIFTLQENESGSLILRWELGTLSAGESALVRFQAKVR